MDVPLARPTRFTWPWTAVVLGLHGENASWDARRGVLLMFAESAVPCSLALFLQSSAFDIHGSVFDP